MLSPAHLIPELLKNNSTLLSICCGIGGELQLVPDTVSISAVDIVPEYVAEFKKRFPKANTRVEDAVTYLKSLPDKCFDVVSCIDGIEHLPKKKGIELLKEAKRVCVERVIIFTPQGYIRNEPEHTWGIDGGDHYQRHLSGWLPEDLLKYDYELWQESESTSTHGEAFNEAIYVYNRRDV